MEHIRPVEWTGLTMRLRRTTIASGTGRPPLHCTWSPSNRFWPNIAWEVTVSLHTGQKRNPGSGRDTAPRTSAYGSSSVQIPLPWACLASSGDSGQPFPVEGSTWPVGHTYLVATGEGWAAADEGSPGSQPKKGRLGHFTLPSLHGPGSSAGGDGMQVGGGQESTQRPQVPPVPHPLYSYPFCGGTTCSCLVPVITVGPHLGGGQVVKPLCDTNKKSQNYPEKSLVLPTRSMTVVYRVL